jgi:hypothetical protein
LKKTLAIFINLLILFQFFGQVWIIVTFKVNQEYIAKNLCVQRDVKNNCCQGYCQLKKQLAEKDKREQRQLPRNSSEKNIFSFFICDELSSYKFITAIKEHNFDNYLCFFSSSLKCVIFHPPKMLQICS